jgi:hypothetical protein
MGMVTAIVLFWSNKPNPAIEHHKLFMRGSITDAVTDNRELRHAVQRSTRTGTRYRAVQYTYNITGRGIKLLGSLGLRPGSGSGTLRAQRKYLPRRCP